MAETVAPSVRGRQRLLVELALLGGAVGTATITAFVAALVIQAAASGFESLHPYPGIGSSAERIVIAVVAVGVVLDAAHLVTGRLSPISIGRQVPREWGRLLPLPVTAGLYGARMGVGPLTILSTWMWWAALIAASFVGVWPAVGVSIFFAVTRVAVNGLVGRRLAANRASNLATVGLMRRRSWSSLTGLAAAMTVTAAVLVGCGLTEPAARPVLAEQATADRTISIISSEAVATPPTAPARLEDFVRTSSTLDTVAESATQSATEPVTQSPTEESAAPSPTTGAANGSGSPAVVAGDDPLGLQRLALQSVTGMEVIDDPSVNRFLDIDEAAAIQPDPTEEIALLETRGYRGGWIRAFRSPTTDVAVASVYEFDDATEAEFYLEDGLITIGGYGGTFFDIAELPGVRGFQQDVVDDGETVRTLGGAFQRDNRWYLLYIVGSPTTVTADVLIPALRSWHAELIPG